MKYQIKTLVAAALLAGTAVAQAALVQIGSGAIVSSAGLITFSEQPLGTGNPIYQPGGYSGSNGATVTFGSYFQGQGLGSGLNGTCPTGSFGNLTCATGMPSAGGPLALTTDIGTPGTSIVNDALQPGTPVLSGGSAFRGPIAILFSTLQAAVGFDAGFFNAIGSVRLTAFSSTGAELGHIDNASCGFDANFSPNCGGAGVEYLGVAAVTAAGGPVNQIAGVLLNFVNYEPNGFTIDNLRFATSTQVNLAPPTNPTPEPASLALTGLGLLALAAARRRRR